VKVAQATASGSRTASGLNLTPRVASRAT
jgi:hypothetical protein